MKKLSEINESLWMDSIKRANSNEIRKEDDEYDSLVKYGTSKIYIKGIKEIIQELRNKVDNTDYESSKNTIKDIISSFNNTHSNFFFYMNNKIYYCHINELNDGGEQWIEIEIPYKNAVSLRLYIMNKDNIAKLENDALLYVRTDDDENNFYDDADSGSNAIELDNLENTLKKRTS